MVMISLPPMSLGHWFCVSRKCGIRLGGSMTMSEFHREMPLVGGRTISLTLSVKGPRIQTSHLVWPPVPSSKTTFSARVG